MLHFLKKKNYVLKLLDSLFFMFDEFFAIYILIIFTRELKKYIVDHLCYVMSIN